jgi:hypothetical protein
MPLIPLPITDDLSKNDRDLITAVNRVDDWKGWTSAMNLSWEE